MKGIVKMNRRDFLSGGLSLGGLMATSALPVLADDPSLFPSRGRFERLSLGYHHIHVGAAKPFSVLHVSDTHLTAAYPDEGCAVRAFMDRRRKTFGGRQEEALRDTLSWAKEHVDFVLHTGDLIDAVSKANFDLVRKYFGEESSPVFGCLGNHEYYLGYDKALAAGYGKDRLRSELTSTFPFDISFASKTVNGVNFVTLDNSFGTVTAEQATRFGREVAKGLPIVLAVHCPFMTPKIACASDKFWKTRDMKSVKDVSKWRASYKDAATADFVAWLKAQPLLKGILAGHLHVDVQDRFSPTAVEYVVAGNFLFHGQEITFS